MRRAIDCLLWMIKRTSAISARVLESEGYHCREASDGEQGLELTLAEPVDLVLLDIDMPRLRGPEVLRRLRGSALASSQDHHVLRVRQLG